MPSHQSHACHTSFSCEALPKRAVPSRATRWWKEQGNAFALRVDSNRGREKMACRHAARMARITGYFGDMFYGVINCSAG